MSTIGTPPKFLLAIFRWFCHPDYAEDIEGDLLERFEYIAREKGMVAARWSLTLEIIRLCRPEIIRNLNTTNPLNHRVMLKNYLKIGYRNLLRNKSNAMINIGGLAIGMVVFLLICLWMVDENSFDKSNPSHDKIAMVLKKRTLNGETGVRFSMPIPVEEELRTTYGEDFKYVTVTAWRGPCLIDTEDKQLNLIGNYMSANGPKLLDLDMLEGTQDALSDQFSVILSRQAAKALYGDANPIGKLLTIDGEVKVTVTGIYENISSHSSFYGLSLIANFDGYASTQDWIGRARNNRQWGTNFCRIYVQLNDHASFDAVNQKIEKVIYDHVNEFARTNDPKIFLHPMDDWHLRTNWENGVQTGGPMQYLWLFGSVGIFVLLLACINFMNLSTAQAERRAKEVGIRKSLGSVRSQLVLQFLVESTMIVSLAFVLSVLMAVLAMPYFNQLADKDISIPFNQPYFWLGSILLVVFTSLLAASYPAFHLSGFRPVSAIKRSFNSGKVSTNLRRGLVVIQFVVSTILVTGTLIIHKQINHTKDRSIGYNPSNLLSIRSSATPFQGKHDMLHDELMKTGAVASMSQSSSPLTEINTSFAGFNWEGKDPELSTNFVFSYVTPEFGETIKWQIKDGRDFTSRKSDEQTFIFNQTAIDFMGMDQPIGKVVQWKGKDYRIIGVVEDLIIDSPFDQAKPAVYTVNASESQWMQIRPVDHLPLAQSLTEIENVFKEVIPNVPFEFELIAQQHEHKFASVQRISDMSGIFTLLAIFISALGLTGLVSYVAERKTKEIGIRKVLGASIKNIVWLLSSEFGTLIVIALIISVPVSYYLSNIWLRGFAYRINLEWWYFLLAGLTVLVIAIITVSRKTIVAATSNPVKSLRDE